MHHEKRILKIDDLPRKYLIEVSFLGGGLKHRENETEIEIILTYSDLLKSPSNKHKHNHTLLFFLSFFFLPFFLPFFSFLFFSFFFSSFLFFLRFIRLFLIIWLFYIYFYCTHFFEAKVSPKRLILSSFSAVAVNSDFSCTVAPAMFFFLLSVGCLKRS